MRKLIITDGGRIMIVFRLVFAFLLLSAQCDAQKEDYKLSEKLVKRQSATDTLVIKSLITDFITVGRIGNTDRIKMFLSSKLVTNKNLNTKNIQFNISQFNINDISVSTTGDNATAEFNIVNVLTKEIIKDRMTFERESGQWKITNSTLLLDIMQKTIPAECENEFDSINPSLYTTKSKTKANLQTNGLLNNSTTSLNAYDVSQFYLSTTALIKRHTMLTGLTDNLPTINRSVVKNRVGGPVFTAINEGKFVVLEGDDEDIFGIVADSGWNRIVYGSANNESINSYGDHNGDHGLDRASSVAVDKFGNVLVLAGVPTRIYKFKYDKTSDYLNFNKIITLPGVQEATDICFDYAGTPDIPDDDSFWLTDKKGDAIFNLTLDGQFPSNKPGLYYRVMNAAGEVLEFNGPTRVVANYGKAYFQSFDKNLAIIDSDKKRIVIIDFISTFEGNTIRGEYTVVNFTGQTNVSLNSIGYPFTPYNSVWQTANGLWVADPNNNMFHIFDGNYTRTGYLGSIKSLSPGIDEWAAPKSLISTSMSNSPLDATDFVTMDKYDDTHGMNTYFTGVDMVNIITHPAWGPNTGIDASFPTSTIVSQIAIYNLARSDPSTFVRITTLGWGFPAGRVKDIIIGNTPGDFPVGKYEALFTLIPAENSSSYRSGYQQTVIKSVQFAMPPDGTLTGPLWGMSGTNYTWQINMTCGSGDFTYTWSKQDDGSNVWQPISSSAWKKTILQMGGTSFTLKCDVTDNFNGQIKSFTQHISSGKLVANETWFGYMEITGPITVPAGITLTIHNDVTRPFTHLFFLNGASLTVNGSLVVNGESTNKIIFDFIAPNSTVQNCIRINTGGSLAVSHSIIKNGYMGLYISQAVATIANSEITSCTHGICITGTNYSATTSEITNCKIHSNIGGFGFLITSSSPTLIGNEIYNNFTGVFLGSMSQPNFGNLGNYGNNNIHNNTAYGIYETYYSTPFLGRDACEIQGGNNILENNGIRDLYVTSYVPVIAENNWWGSNSPSTTKIYSNYNTIDYAPWLGSRPTQQYANMKLSPEENLFNSKFDNGRLSNLDKNIKKTAEIADENISLKGKNLNTQNGISEIDYVNIKPISAVLDSNLSLIYKLGYAKRQIDLKHYQTAQLIAKEIIEKYPDSSASFFALGLLWQASKVNDLESYKTFLKDLGIKKSKKELYGVAEIIESGFNKSDRFVKLNQIMNKYKKTKTAEYAYLDLFMYYAFELNDKIKAKETGDLITSSFPNTPAAMMINQLAEINNRLMAKKATTSEASNSDNELPTEYELLGNYPNPFNPSTTISYALPLQSSVEINIFDIMGRLVRTFELNGQSAGYQNVLWNGRNENNEQVASGIYLYRFKAIATDGKVFEKTAKLLMLK